MRQRFTVIEGGAAAPGAVIADAAVTGSFGGPVTWRIDLRKPLSIGEGEVAAWRALLVRSGAADPVHADPDYLLSAAQHQAGGREIVFALAWAVGAGPERLGAVVPLALPHTLWGHGRIVLWQPHGTAVAPTFATDSAAAVREALVERLRELRPRAIPMLDEPVADAPQDRAPAPRLAALPRRASIPAHSLIGVRAIHAPAPPVTEWISEPHRIRDAVEAFLLLDAEVSTAPIIADPSEAAMVRVVTRLFAQRRQATVALTRRDGAVVAASVTLGVGAESVIWKQVAGNVAPERIARPA
jgi:hypothetical protein